MISESNVITKVYATQKMGLISMLEVESSKRWLIIPNQAYGKDATKWYILH